jgi:hypothetical protein
MREVGGSSPSATTTCCDAGGYRPVKRLIRIYVREISTVHCAADFIAVLDISASNGSSTSKALLKSITECGSIMPLAFGSGADHRGCCRNFPAFDKPVSVLCLFPSILLQGIGDRLWRLNLGNWKVIIARARFRSLEASLFGYLHHCRSVVGGVLSGSRVQLRK